MSAGQFRQYLVIETPVETPDGRGGATVTWTTHWEGPARIERRAPPLHTVERLLAGGVRSMPLCNIVLRADEGTECITDAMRATDADTGAAFNILSAQNIDGRREYITLTALENTPT